MRPSTEWVDTLAAGANVLVDDDPERIAAAARDGALPRGRAAALRRRTRLPRDRGGPRYGATRHERDADTHRDAVAAPTRPVDVAVIGAGYVGLPLAQTFAEAGQAALLVDVVADVVEALNRGESHIRDVPTERLRPLVESGRDPGDDRLRRGRAARTRS